MTSSPRQRRASTLRHLALLAACLGGAACGASQRASVDESPAEASPPPVEYTFEPVLIRGSVSEAGEVSSVATDLPSLFREANDYLAVDDYDDALRLYELILDTFDDEDYERVTMYNAGLSLEGLQRYDEADERYREIIERWPASEDAALAHLRRAECLSQLGRYERIPRLMERALRRGDLRFAEELEAHLRWGNALLETRNLTEAEFHFREIVDLNERAARSDLSGRRVDADPLRPSHPIIAQAYFGRGRVYHLLFREIKLVLPVERMTEDLVDKGELFTRAQTAYLDAVRTGQRYWAPAAGFMVGQLFEDFYFDVLASEIPTTFNELELEIYFEELREFIEPALVRARRIHEHNLAMSIRLGSNSGWGDESLERVEFIEQYLRGRERWDAEHRLVIEGAHPRSARFGRAMQFRDERDRAREARSEAGE